MIERKLHHFYRSSVLAASPQRWRGVPSPANTTCLRPLNFSTPCNPGLPCLPRTLIRRRRHPMALVLLALTASPAPARFAVSGRGTTAACQIFVDGGELRMNRLTRLSKDEAGAARACATRSAIPAPIWKPPN